ncbi:MAG: conjugal transfer protein TraF [Bermanella sp.]
MKKYLAAAALVLPALSQAAPVVTQPGALMTLGTSPSPQTGLSVLYNPAAAEAVLNKDDNFRWGYLGSSGISVELGDADNFADDVNQLMDDMDLDNVSSSDADRVINDYNNNLRHKLGDAGYMKIDVQFVAPLAPLLMRSDLLGGVMSIDLVGGVTAKISILDDDLVFNEPSDSYETNTAAYIKSVQYTTLGLGYSRELDNLVTDKLNEHVAGRLLAGVRLNMYSLSLSKQVIGLLNIDEDDDLADVITDDYDNNQVTSTDIGMDLGLIWEADNYHLGFTWRNINEPEFDFGALGQDCSNAPSNTSESNCFTALYFAGQERLALQETHVMTSQATADAALNSADKRWRLATSYDLQPVRDPVGDEYQWLTASAAYVSSRAIGVRVGISQNQVGSELTMVNAGLSLFGNVNLDLRYSLDTIEVDGESTPRTFGLNLGFESSF